MSAVLAGLSGLAECMAELIGASTGAEDHDRHEYTVEDLPLEIWWLIVNQHLVARRPAWHAATERDGSQDRVDRGETARGLRDVAALAAASRACRMAAHSLRYRLPVVRNPRHLCALQAWPTVRVAHLDTRAWACCRGAGPVGGGRNRRAGCRHPHGHTRGGTRLSTLLRRLGWQPARRAEAECDLTAALDVLSASPEPIDSNDMVQWVTTPGQLLGHDEQLGSTEGDAGAGAGAGVGAGLRITCSVAANPAVQPATLDYLGLVADITVLDLARSFNMTTLPEDIAALQGLTRLVLAWCPSLTLLPDALCDLGALEELDLGGCTSLVKLPPALSNLTRLESLNAYLNTSMDSASKQCILALPSLTRLGIDGPLSVAGASPWACTRLEELRVSNFDALDSLPALPALQVLALHSHNLVELPAAMDTRFPRLRLVGLRFRVSFHLQALDPSGLTRLQSLRSLTIKGCAGTALPPALFNLTSLTTLSLTLTRLEGIPEALGKLRRLVSLSFASCTRLALLPDSLWHLPELRVLRITSCDSLLALPEGIGDLSLLETLDLYGCSNLQCLPGSIGRLRALRTLRLALVGQDHPRDFFPSSMQRLRNLRELDLSHHAFRELPGWLRGMALLDTLKLAQCRQLVVLPDWIATLTHLRVLWLCRAVELAALPTALCSLKHLRLIDISSCYRLVSVPAPLSRFIGENEPAQDLLLLP